jgi:hypothetical protein
VPPSARTDDCVDQITVRLEDGQQVSDEAASGNFMPMDESNLQSGARRAQRVQSAFELLPRSCVEAAHAPRALAAQPTIWSTWVTYMKRRSFTISGYGETGSSSRSLRISRAT